MVLENLQKLIRMFYKFLTHLRQFVADEGGPTAVEYAVMLMLVFLAVISVIQVLGQVTTSSFQNSAEQIIDAMNNT